MVLRGHDNLGIAVRLEAHFDGVHNVLQAKIERVYIFLAEKADIDSGHEISLMRDYSDRRLVSADCVAKPYRNQASGSTRLVSIRSATAPNYSTCSSLNRHLNVLYSMSASQCRH